MSSLWVSKKKKVELIDLCDQLGLQTDGYLKSDIENLLINYLNTHSSDLTNDSTFSAYYDTLGSRSPTKAPNYAVLVAPGDAPATRSRWRASRAAPENSTADFSTGEESASPAPSLTERTLRSGSRQLTTRTPRTVRTVREEVNEIPVPLSPAIVADAIESRANAIKDSAMKAVESVSLQDKATDLRDRLSNVVSVNAVTLTYEAAFLLYRLIPFVYFETPAVAVISAAPRQLLLPDLFVLLTAEFWGPFLAWVTTAIVVPLGNAYFFNLTATAANVARSKPYDPTISTSTEEYKTDPLTFAVTKALVAYLVHYKGFNFLGLFGGESLKAVEAGVGRETQLIGAGIAGLAAVWESILRR